MVLVHIDIPDEYQKKVTYCFGILSKAWGLPVKVLNEDILRKPHIVYSKRREEASLEGVFSINFDDEMYDPGTICDLVQVNGIDLWMKPYKDTEDADSIAGIYRLLTFMDELQIRKEYRDRKGIFKTSALPRSRRKALQVPLVENHATYLLRELIKYYPYLNDLSIPRWPNGKKYVISITHDTDAVDLGSPKEMATNLVKSIIRQDRIHFDMFKMGVGFTSKDKFVSNPLFGFPNWRSYEESIAIRSCFYLFIIPPGTKLDINDCKSSVIGSKTNWGILKEMVRNGWEFGLHAPINAKHRTDSFASAKYLLEEKLAAPIFGLRHHYWALDWMRPYKTFRKHVDAGFIYDTSIAWRDAPGFRAATCFPFQPFDPIREKPLKLFELPTCLMDEHVINDDNEIETSIKLGKDIIYLIKEYGGVAVLNWHTESACDILQYNNYFTLLREILFPFINDPEVWFATPHEIIKFWHQRSEQISQIECLPE